MNLFFLTPFFRGPLLKNKTSRNQLLLSVKMLITVLLINQWITIGKKYFADHDAIRMVEREAALQRHIVADLIGVLLLQIDSKLVLKPKGERERRYMMGKIRRGIGRVAMCCCAIDCSCRSCCWP